MDLSWFCAGPRQLRSRLRLCDAARLFHQFLPHQPMQEVDRLERAYHHLEMRDPPVLVESDDVDTVELDSLDLVLEFEHRAGIVAPFAAIGEAQYPPSTFSALDRYLKVMSRPRCGVCTTGLSNTASGCSRSHSAA